MGKQNVHFQHFSVGEYSNAGQARVDQERTRLAADVQENIFSHAVGKGMVRPGTTYIGSTPNNERVRLIPFVRDIDDVALIEMSAARLRIWVDDALVTRADVDSTVTNGDFSSSTGWTLSASSGAHATISGGVLTMDADARGSEAYCERAVTTNDANTEHALDIVVTRGPVLFRCGSSSGAQDYIYETKLDTGYHSLSFTPTGTYYVRLITREQRDCIVDSIQVASAGVMTLTAPWSESDLREISFDQSADVIFLASKYWQQRKIERRNPTSWSLALYQSDDGPFITAPDGVSVTPLGTHGNVTLTATSPVFTPAMVGSLVRLYHDRLNQTVQLAGNGEFTDVFTIRGIKGENFNDRTFSYSTSGTWSGTMRLQRSLTGVEGDFLDYNYDDGTSATTFTSNKTVTHVGQQDDNNIIAYMRIGFIDGAYTSGAATVNVQYSGFSGYGVARIYQYNSPTDVYVEVLEPFNSSTITSTWEIGAWSSYNGWPSAVALFDGRLWWGGQDTFWGSVSDNYYSFDDLETTDASTIERQVATGGQVSQINWFLPLQRLLIGTTGSIASARSPSFDEPLTPGGITVKDAATIGGSYVSPVKVDSRGVFVHRSGETIQTLLYSVDNQDYTAKDMTGMNGDICGDGIVELAASREPDTFIWCVREDGQVALLIYEYAENMGVEGWSRFVTNGVVESVCTLPGDTEDAVYLAVDRTNEEEVIFTGAEELASVATGDVAAWDFTDQSVYVSDATTPANDVNSQGQTDGWGGLSGPNANVASSTSLNASNPKLLRQSTGLLAFQPHNYVTYSEALEESDWGKYKVWISPEMFEAPDGTMTARKVIEQGGASGYHMWSIPIAGIPIYSLVELTFWAKPLERTVLKAGYGLNHAVGSTYWLNNYDYVEDYLYLDTGLPADDYVWAWSYPYEPYSGDYSDFGGNGALTSEDAGDGWYRYSLKLLTGNADSMIYFRMYNQSESSFYVGDDSSGLLLWGVQVNRIPVIETQQGQMSRYVKTEGTALMTMPYQWTSAGVLEGMRVEPDGQTYLPCGKNFNDFYTKSNSTIGWAYAGEDLYYPDLDPTQVPEAATFTESGSDVVPHYIERVFVGPNGYWDLSIHVKTIDAPFIGLSLITPENDYYFVNFSTGTGAMTLESVSDGITITDYGVESYALGWSRVWIMANITVSLPGAMRAQGSATVSFASIPPASLSSTGTSVAAFLPGEVTKAAATMAGTTGGTFYGEAPVAAAPATNYMINGSFETGDKTGWTNTVGTWSVTAFAPWIPVPDGSYMASTFTSSAGFLYQDNDIIANGMYTSGEIATGTATINVSYWYGSGTSNNSAVVAVRALNSGGGVISTLSNVSNLPAATNTWYFNETGDLTLPTNTAKVRITLTVSHTSGFFYDAKFDDIQLTRPVDPGLSTLTSANTASVSFGRGGSAIASSGTAAATFNGETTASADLSVSGTSTFAGVPSVGTLSSPASASASFVSLISVSSAFSASCSATVSFEDGNAVFGTLTESGTSTSSFVGAQANTQALMRVYITNSAEPTIDSLGRPVHESTGLKTLIWGAQLEAGRLRPSSYMPTSWDGTGGSRVGDSYNTPLTNVPWDETQATLYVEAKQYDALASGSLGSENTGPAFGIDSGGDDVHFLRSDTSGDLRYEIINNGTVEASIDGGTWTLDTAFELAASATADDARLVVDGGSAVADTSLTMPTIPQSGSLVVFGHSDDGTYSFDGIIKRALLIPATSTTAELQVLGDPAPTPNLRFIEKLNLRSEAQGATITKMADAGIFAEGPVSSVTAAWLAERTNLVGWGTLLSDGLMYPLTGLSADTSGVISLGGSYLNVFVGLGYTAKYKTGKLAHGAFGGTALLQRKRIGELSLLMQNVHRDAVSFGSDFDTMRKMSLIKGGRTQSATTVYTIHDEIGFSLPGYWDTDSRVCLQVAAPYPCTFLGLVISVETNERGL